MLETTDNIRPLRDRVLVKELPWPGKTGGGLFLPDQAKKRDELWRAVVVAVGPGKPPIGLLKRSLKLLADALDAGTIVEWSAEVDVLMHDVRDGISVGFGADVKPGDVVLVSKYVHTKVRVGGEECCIIAATDVLGVVTDGSEQLREALLGALGRIDPTIAAREDELEFFRRCFTSGTENERDFLHGFRRMAVALEQIAKERMPGSDAQQVAHEALLGIPKPSAAAE